MSATTLCPVCAPRSASSAGAIRCSSCPAARGFADAVRDADRRFGLQAETAHRMAILGMEQFGWLLSDLIPGAERCTDLTHAGAGRTRVLLPAGLSLDELPASWDVTSDSIAAWVAREAGAERLVLVKAADGLGVDEYFPKALEGARFETWVIGPRSPRGAARSGPDRPLATVAPWLSGSCGSASWLGISSSRNAATGPTSSPGEWPACSGIRRPSTSSRTPARGRSYRPSGAIA